MKIWMSRKNRRCLEKLINNNLSGTFAGKQLRKMGFTFFERDRKYTLEGVDQNGIVEVYSWCEEDGPDEYGFGREEFYDWWFLDRQLNEIPGVQPFFSYSFHERRTLSDRFDVQYKKAVMIISAREHRQ